MAEYNKNKGGVDVTDQVTKKFSCQRATRRWSKALFENLVDLSIHNSFIIFKWANPSTSINKRNYIEWLAKDLAISHVKARKQQSFGMHTDIVDLMNTFIENYDALYGPTSKPTATCKSCDEGRGLLVCAKCKSAVCSTHCKVRKFYRCSDCESVETGEVRILKEVKRCSFCPRNKDRKTSVVCHNCGRFLCSNHKKLIVQLNICTTCFPV